MHPLLRVALIRFAAVLAAALVGTVILMVANAHWRDTGFGNTSQYIDRSDGDLWGQALMSGGVVVGVALLWNYVATLFVTWRYPVGGWAYWVSFTLIAAWSTFIAYTASQPISDAGFAIVAIFAAVPVTVVCFIIGLVEELTRYSRKTAPVVAL